MSDPQRLVDLAIVFVGGAGILFMAMQIHRTVSRGTIARRTPLQPVTRSDAPLLFWAFVVFCTLGTAIVIWGWIVAVLQLLAAN